MPALNECRQVRVTRSDSLFVCPRNLEPEHFTLSGAPVSDPASAMWLGDAGSETGAPVCGRFKASVKTPG